MYEELFKIEAAQPERLFDDKIETFYVRSKTNDFMVSVETYGCYDENNEETTGIGAQIELTEITGHNQKLLNTIKIMLPMFEKEYCYQANGDRKTIKYFDESSPDNTRDVLNKVFTTLATLLV